MTKHEEALCSGDHERLIQSAYERGRKVWNWHITTIILVALLADLLAYEIGKWVR